MFIRVNNTLTNINNCHVIEITKTDYIKFTFTQSNLTVPIKDASIKSILNEIENSIIKEALFLDISKHIDNSDDRYKDQ